MPLAVTLAELRSPLEQSYRNTVYCSATLNQEDGKLTGSYCGNRWCMVCNRIRTARAITRYLPIAEGWDDAYMVTLTRRNVPAPALRGEVTDYVREFQACKLAMRRTNNVKLVALRKLECTYNARRDDFHPHFHVVVRGEAAARLLQARWLERNPDTTDAQAQDVRRCDGATLREVFKYFTKLLAKTRTNPGEGKRSAPVAPAALDVIFRAMKGHRVYQPVGFKVAADAPDDAAEELSELDATPALTPERATWEWSQGATDWVDVNTGECLTGYEPVARFRELVTAIAEQPPAPTLPPADGEPCDVAQSRDSMRRRIAQRERPHSVDFVSATLKRVYALSDARAKAAAALVLAPPPAQLTLLDAGANSERRLANSERRFTRRR